MTNPTTRPSELCPGRRQLTPVPRDGRLLALILASKGIQDADDRVIHQLLDFAHRELFLYPLIPTSFKFALSLRLALLPCGHVSSSFIPIDDPSLVVHMRHS